MLGSLLLLQQLICVRPLTTICGIILYLHFSTTRHILCLKFKVLGIDGKFPNLLKRFGNLNKASIERPLKSTMNCWWGVLTNRYANFFNLSDTNAFENYFQLNRDSTLPIHVCENNYNMKVRMLNLIPELFFILHNLHISYFP